MLRKTNVFVMCGIFLLFLVTNLLAWTLNGTSIRSDDYDLVDMVNDNDGSIVIGTKYANTGAAGKTHHIDSTGRIINEADVSLGVSGVYNDKHELITDNTGGFYNINPGYPGLIERYNGFNKKIWSKEIGPFTGSITHLQNLQSSYRTCSDQRGGVYFTWSLGTTYDNYYHDIIFLGHINKFGVYTTSSILTVNHAVTISLPNDCIPEPMLVPTNDGSVYLSWLTRSTETTRLIRASKYDINLNKTVSADYYDLGTTNNLYEGAHFLPYHAISDSNNGLIVYWNTFEVGSSNTYLATKSSSISSTGSSKWYSVPIFYGTEIDGQFGKACAAVSDANGGAFFIGTNPHLLARHIDKNGNLYNNTITITTTNAGYGSDVSAIIAKPNSGAYIVWKDYSTLGSNTAIFRAQSISVNLDCNWGPNGYSFSTAINNNYGLNIMSNDNGGFYAAWPTYDGVYAIAVESNQSILTTQQVSWNNYQGDINSSEDYHYWAIENSDTTHNILPTITWESTYSNKTGVWKITFTNASQGAKLTSIGNFTPTSDWYQLKMKYCCEGSLNGAAIQPTLLLFPATTTNAIHGLGTYWNGRNLINNNQWTEIKTYVRKEDMVTGKNQIIIYNDLSTSTGSIYIKDISLSAVTPLAILSTNNTYSIPSFAKEDAPGKDPVVYFGMETINNIVFHKIIMNDTTQGIKLTSTSNYSVSSGKNAVFMYDYFITADASTVDMNNIIYSGLSFPYEIGLMYKKGLNTLSWGTGYGILDGSTNQTNYQPQIILYNNDQIAKDIYLYNFRLLVSQ